MSTPPIDDRPTVTPSGQVHVERSFYEKVYYFLEHDPLPFGVSTVKKVQEHFDISPFLADIIVGIVEAARRNPEGWHEETISRKT